MDVLSQVLAHVRIIGSVLAEIECRGAWAIDLLEAAGTTVRERLMPFHYILEGDCWLIGETGASPLSAGDLIAAPQWPLHAIVSAPGQAAIPITEIIAANGLAAWEGGTMSRPLSIKTGEGETTARILSGVFAIRGYGAEMLMDQLPPLLQIAGQKDNLDAQFVTALSFIRQEGSVVRPGYIAVAERLTDLLFIQILRAGIAASKVRIGLLAALSNKNISRALLAIHANPAGPWSVARLAQEAFLSRTVFAERFHELVGITPMHYVNRWRMTIAQDLLSASDKSIGEIQTELGFSSSFAFSRALRAHCGMSPREYRASLVT